MAFSYNGSSYLATPTLSHGIGTGDFSLACWAYITSATALSRPLIEIGTTIFLNATSSTTARVAVRISGTGQLNFDTIPTANAWQHYAITRTGTTIRAYLNGVLEATTHTSSVSLPDASIKIGRADATGSSLVNGSRIAEAALWSVALSAGEVAALAKRIKPPDVRPNGLRMYYPLLSERVDRWSFGASATVTGTEAYTTHPPMVDSFFVDAGDVTAGGGGGGASGGGGSLLLILSGG